MNEEKINCQDSTCNSSPFLCAGGVLGDVHHGTGLVVPLEVLRGGEAGQAERADEALLGARAPGSRLIAETETSGGRVRNRLGLLGNIF